MVRLLMVLLLAGVAAGCTTNHATTSAQLKPGEDPYFLCYASADFVRRHIDICSGILK